ncbi:MAG: YCF48-related protein [Methanobacteriota archaeon]
MHWIFVLSFLLVFILVPVSTSSLSRDRVLNPIQVIRGGWEAQESGITDVLCGVSFATKDVGVAVGGQYWKGIILRTTDGGKTWDTPSKNRDIPDQPDPLVMGLKDVSLYNTDVGVACGYDGIIVYTTDCFKNYEVIQPNYNICTYYGAQSSDSNFQCVVGTNSFLKSLVVVTHDGWVTCESNSFWLMHPDLPMGFDASLLDVCFINPDVGFAVAGVCYGQGAVIRSTNGGVDWTTVFWDDSRSVQAVDFPSARVGYAAGNFGMLVKTLDGGETWSYLQSGVGVTLRDVSFVTEQVGTVVGDNGVILRTNDGGVTWYLQYTGVHADLFAVDFIDAFNGYAVGEDGVIMHTRTGGFPITVTNQ